METRIFDKNNPPCTWCGSSATRKMGKRKTRLGFKQMFWCNECESKFTDGKIIAPAVAPEVYEPMPRFTYPQNWVAYNKAQTEEGRMFRQILFELCTDIVQKRYKFGRPRAELNDLVFSICDKVYTGFSSRRLISDLEYANVLDYISHVPHFNTLLNAMQSEEVEHILQELIKVSCMPMKFLEDTYAADSTGFSTSMFSRWMEKKYGKDEEQKERVWVKAHAMIGTRTNAIASIEITTGNKGDSPMFISLLNKAKEGAKMLDVCADKAYSSKANLEAVTKLGAIPYIPFKDNTTGRAGGSRVWKTIYNYFILHKDEFMDHYHQRSNVESTFSMVKRKFGNNVRSKTFQGMKNEILAKAVVHNICCLIASTFEFGINLELIWGKPRTAETSLTIPSANITGDNYG